MIKTEIAPFNPLTLKTIPQNQTWSGVDHTLRRYGHSKFDIAQGVHSGPPILREEVVGVIDQTIGKSNGGFPYATHCDHCTPLSLTIRPQFDIKCLQYSIQQGVS